MPCCPSCRSLRIWKDGLRQTGQGEIQRYLCRDCGKQFSDTALKGSDPFDSLGRVHSKKLCRGPALLLSAKSAPAGAKNLAGNEQEPRLRNTSPTPAEMQSKIVEYSFWLLKNGYKESTILGRTKLLKIMVKRGANLFDPESIKETIAKQKTWSEGRKENAVDAYTNFLIMVGGKWNPPRYKRIRKLPFIPTETEIDQLIAACGRKTGTFVQLLKETGMRAGEAWDVEWIDLDTVSNTVKVTPEKNSNPRIFKVSRKLIDRLNELPRKSKKVFGGTLLKTQRRVFQEQRKRIAEKLKNPRILRITFLTLRHFKGTMEYHRTKDILHVMRVLGHKNIKNTLIYTHLVNFQDDDYVSRVAWTLEEGCKLVEAGFEYVTEIEGGKIFRKRK